MRSIFYSTIALVFSASFAFAQDPPPCSPESPIEHDCYAPENGNCQPCFLSYCVDTDTNYGIACGAECENVRYDVCAPDRQVIQTQLFGCHYDGQACPTIQFPYLCQLETIVYDYCTNQTCGPYTLSPPFCNDRLSSTKTESRPSNIQVACTIPRLDRFGPKVEVSRPLPIPAGLLLKARYKVLLSQMRPGAKCIQTKHYLKTRKKGGKV